MSAGRNECDEKAHDAELNQIEQCFNEGFRRDRGVWYEGFEGIESLEFQRLIDLFRKSSPFGVFVINIPLTELSNSVAVDVPGFPLRRWIRLGGPWVVSRASNSERIIAPQSSGLYLVQTVHPLYVCLFMNC